MTGVYYAKSLHKLLIAVKEESQGKLTKVPLLLHDRAPAHRSHVGRAVVINRRMCPKGSSQKYFVLLALKNFRDHCKLCTEKGSGDYAEKYVCAHLSTFRLK